MAPTYTRVMEDGVLVERETEQAWLSTPLHAALQGRGSLVLVAGEAGIGKTRLSEQAVDGIDAHILRGTPGPGAVAYGPIITALRSFLRNLPDGFEPSAPLRPHLALLLPELGEPAPSSDRATLFEAIRCALVKIVERRPAVLLLDDLQASDDATLEVLAALADPLEEMPLLVVGTYRSDEVPRTHPLRRLRDELRREARLHELTLRPLTREGTAALVARVLGTTPTSRLVVTLHDRTGGVPFFIEELAAALLDSGRLTSTPVGLDLVADDELPLPQTVRDAVALRAAALSATARTTAEAASVAGTRVDLDLLAAIGAEGGLEELEASGLLVAAEPGVAMFRHPLLRDAIYEDVPWLQCRALHRQLAEALEQRGGRHAEIAAHRLAARDTEGALDALVLAAGEAADVYAYRDATRFGREALAMWPEGERRAERLAVLERHARVAELTGDLAEAARAQREVVAARRSETAGRALADAERRLAGIYELQGDRERAIAARRVASDAYAANGLPADAATERLNAARALEAIGAYTEAAALADQALEEAGRAGRTDLRARALGQQGITRVKAGDTDAGIERLQAGLSLALEHELSLEAAAIYQRLGTANEISGDYAGARDALATAVGVCDTHGDPDLRHLCLSCMAYVLRELGDWDRAVEIAEDLRPPGATLRATLVADGMLGGILAFRGGTAAGRPLLLTTLDTATRVDSISMAVDSAACLAWLEQHEGNTAQAREHIRFLLERWERSEDHHYAVWGLRWAATWLAGIGELADARACIEALSAIAADTGHADALAALAHALGESALADGEIETAVDQIEHALTLHERLDIPFERAQIALRAGIALSAAGRPDDAVARFREAHRAARRLGAAPLAAQAAEGVARLGASVEEQLGRRAAADHEHAGLSRRELEVMRFVASGRTNREIADELVLSTRTVDMHVRNILTKLRCRSRTEAATRAGDLGLLG